MKTKRILFLLITILFISCNSNSEEANKHYSKAEKFYKSEDYGNALIEINKSINLDPSNNEYLIYSADIKRQLNENDDAIEIFKKVLEKGYKLDSINYEIGKSFFAKSINLSYKGDDYAEEDEALEEAINFYDLALKENIRFYNAYIEKYKALHNLQRYNDAIVVINKAYSVFPDSLNLVLYRGIAKGALGDVQEELKDLNKVISSKDIDSSITSTAYRFRGLVNEEKDEFAKALEDFSNAIELNQENPYPYKDRGDLYLKMKFRDSACQDYRKAADLGYVKLYEIIRENCK